MFRSEFRTSSTYFTETAIVGPLVEISLTNVGEGRPGPAALQRKLARTIAKRAAAT